ncbi:hypothetical protein [Desulfoscipio geothermicus]|uniref:Uncharacterized protein n=1 Tax=Desulfoscipio geothermicus DSM 3669 TaxID=1121426 RepID=A0A1I6E444_9FIRM|nr:hypothetical protein [Desulfoscipio geothermicus]SFR12312.1 hypothetical protein SAMN05660706_1254 [Desulfoscipio geothermicus DSM 3669]
MGKQTDRQEKEHIIISWSHDQTSYDSARKEWVPIGRLDKKSQCALCKRNLEHPVLVRNRFNGQERVVGYVCCRDYITDVDSPDPEASFRKRLARAEHQALVSSLESDLEVVDKQSANFTCPLTGRLPSATGDCDNCTDPVTKRTCLHFFLYPEIGLAAYRNYEISEQKFLNILERIKIRAVEEFVRVARVVSDPQCKELIDPERFQCTANAYACDRYGDDRPCPHIDVLDSLHSVKRFLLRMAGPGAYNSALRGILSRHSISIPEEQESGMSDIVRIRCPHTEVFPDRKNCPNNCSDKVAGKCEEVTHFLEGYQQAGGETTATLVRSILTEQIKEKLGEWWQDLFSSSCALITDPSMSLRDCLKYRCYALRWSYPCPFAKTGMPRSQSHFDEIPSNDDSLDDDEKYIEKRKRQYYLLRKVAIKRLTRKGYMELVSDRAGEGENLATVLPVQEKQRAERQGQLLKTSKRTGQNPRTLLAKARYDALCIKAGVPGLGQENPFKWSEWSEDEILGENLIRDLEEAKLYNLANDARELIFMIQKFNNFPSFVRSLVKSNLHVLTKAFWKKMRYELPQTFQTLKLKECAIKTKQVSKLTRGQIKRWLNRGLPPKEAEFLDAVNYLLKEPISINKLIEISLNQPSPGMQVLCRYLLRYVGCFVHKDIVADNSGLLNGHYIWCERDSFWNHFFRPQGKEHVALERFIEACKSIGLKNLAGDLSNLNKKAANWRWREVKRIYDNFCYGVGLKPLVINRPRNKCVTSFKLGIPSSLNDMLAYAYQEGLTQITKEVDIIRRWQSSGVKKNQIIAAWRESVGMTRQEFHILIDILGFDMELLDLHFRFYDIKKLKSSEWLYLAGRIEKGPNIIRELLRSPLSLNDLKKHILSGNSIRTIIIREGVYAFIYNQEKEIDNLLLAQYLIKHRPRWKGDIPVRILAHIVKQSIAVSEIIAVLNEKSAIGQVV